MKRSPREIKEAKKAYDKVVDHLISEDYAKTKDCLLYTSDAADE